MQGLYHGFDVNLGIFILASWIYEYKYFGTVFYSIFCVWFVSLLLSISRVALSIVYSRLHQCSRVDDKV